VLGSYCQGSVKVLWRRYLSPQPTESQGEVCQFLKCHTNPLKYLQIPRRQVIIISWITKRLGNQLFDFLSFLGFSLFLKSQKVDFLRFLVF